MLAALGIAALAGAGFPRQALAWNGDGHRIVAQIAAEELNDAARAEVERLTGQPVPAALVTLSSWADSVTGTRPETRPWHYVNIPRRAESFDWLRDCPGGACVVGALKTQWAKLRDPDAPDAERREALSFVVHFIADLHQPLHCGDGQDRGGNDIVVEVGGARTNLHRVWDGEFFPWAELARELELTRENSDRATHAPEPDAFDASAFVRWAEESHRRAVEDIYDRLPVPRPDRSLVLRTADISRYWEMARALAYLAGRRLARALEAALEGPVRYAPAMK